MGGDLALDEEGNLGLPIFASYQIALTLLFWDKKLKVFRLINSEEFIYPILSFCLRSLFKIDDIP